MSRQSCCLRFWKKFSTRAPRFTLSATTRPSVDVAQTLTPASSSSSPPPPSALTPPAPSSSSSSSPPPPSALTPPAPSSSSSSSPPPPSALTPPAPSSSSSSTPPPPSLPPPAAQPPALDAASSSTPPPPSLPPPAAQLPTLDAASSSTPPPPSLPPPATLDWDALPDEVWEHVFSFLPADADHGAAQAVCRGWLAAERLSRRRLTVRNCYATTPQHAVERFPSVRALQVKGKPHWADFNALTPDWGAYAAPWVQAAAQAWPLLEELSFKRMVVTDDCLHIIAASFHNLQALRTTKCHGFTADGLAAITRGCRNLKELDLEECKSEDLAAWAELSLGQGPCWLSEFPETFVSLETLNFWSMTWGINLTELERLVIRCRNLKTLKLNKDVPLKIVARLLNHAPQISQLGTGKISDNYDPNIFASLEAAFAGCGSLRSLSGAWAPTSRAYLPAMYSVCEGLTNLNLFGAFVRGPGLVEFISRCKNLLHLCVLDLVEDHGMSVVASTCSKLQELRVIPATTFGYPGEEPFLTERGLVEVSVGCPMLETIMFFCSRMTNEALITVARNLPNMTSFRFYLIEPGTTDYITGQPFDAGFRAIVESCRGLRRLSICARLTDAGFKSIGEHAGRLEVLSLKWAGDSDLGLHYILAGCCSRLKRVQAQACPFGEHALLANAAKLETMRYVWLMECKVTVVACRLLTLMVPRLVVEMINEREPLEFLPSDSPVGPFYVYRTLVGPRTDTPESVQIVAA